VFDDFIAAGEYLKANGITSPNGLAIEGRSNGGLLVGAVVNQRPDLIDAAHAAVGVMDMLRFDRFTAGRYWVDDYGHPNREADFRALLAYSPYHNIRPGVDYPPVLVTTADTDDRVVPGHSFKYISALQAANPNGEPHLIRIETRAGHGSGKPTDKIIEEAAVITGDAGVQAFREFLELISGGSPAFAEAHHLVRVSVGDVLVERDRLVGRLAVAGVRESDDGRHREALAALARSGGAVAGAERAGPRQLLASTTSRTQPALPWPVSKPSGPTIRIRKMPPV
jgi:hypothetical protein